MKILISHAVEDVGAAAAIKELLGRCSLNQIQAWFSSDQSAQGGMPIGGAWFSELQRRLMDSDWVLALVTPRSLKSPWLYFECGFIAANKVNKVVPLVLGIPLSQVPMPLAAYQIYDAENAASLAEFLQKILTSANIMYDEEMTKAVRDAILRRLIEAGSVSAEPSVSQDKDSVAQEIANLKSFIENRFVDLYDLLPTENRPQLSIELAFDASEFDSRKSKFTLNVLAGASFGDVLDEIYFRMENHVKPYRYFIDWVIEDETSGKELSVLNLKELIPANALLHSNTRYKIKKLKNRQDTYFYTDLSEDSDFRNS